jgi:homoserine dehydrogenase
MAVVSDMIEIGRNMYMRAAGAPRAHPMRPVEARKMIDPNDISCRYYLRFGVHDQPGVLGQLMTVLGAHGVSIAQVVQDAKTSPVAVVVLTHEAREGQVRAALDEIDALPIVRQPTRLIRIAE